MSYFFFLTKSSRTLYIYSLRFAFSNSFQCCNPSPKLIRRAPSLQYDVRLSFRSLWELLREARWPVTVGKSSLMIYWPWLRNQDSVTRAGPRSIPELDGVVFISRVTVPTLWIRIRGMKSLESNGSCFFLLKVEQWQCLSDAMISFNAKFLAIRRLSMYFIRSKFRQWSHVFPSVM